MIIFKVTGGLGNQMFQYAFSLKHSGLYNSKIKADLSWFESLERKPHEKFSLSIFKRIGDIDKAKKEEIFEFFRESKYGSKILLNIINKFSSRRKIIEQDFSFSQTNLENGSKNCYLEGYWQSEKYFVDIREQLLLKFAFPELTDVNLKMAEKIGATNSCSLHIRRGDYVSDSLNVKNHGFVGLDYYERAICFILKNYPITNFFIFSDDIEWVKNNLEIPSEKDYIFWNIGKQAINDMHLMSLCNNNIIANSSFSWWGAWLNQNTNKMVVAPKKWFNERDWDTSDLIPSNWIKI